MCVHQPNETDFHSSNTIDSSSSSSSSHDKQFTRNTRVLLLHRFHVNTRTVDFSRVHIWGGNRRGKNRDSPRGYRMPRRYRSACTRVHAISRARKWRNVRNKRLAGQRSGRRWLRAGPPASLLWGQWTGPHRVASRVEESPCVSRSHTRRAHTHAARSSPVQPPVHSHHRRLNHPTFLAPGPLLLPPRLLEPANRYRFQ